MGNYSFKKEMKEEKGKRISHDEIEVNGRKRKERRKNDANCPIIDSFAFNCAVLFFLFAESGSIRRR